MFPTDHRDKIPQTLAYPLNAKAVSEALADIPQAEGLIVGFHMGTTALRPDAEGRRYVLSVHYRPNQGYFPMWTLSVYPVPREVVGHVAELLRAETLIRVRRWLRAKRNPIWYAAEKGLTVQYDEAEDRLFFSEYSRT